MLVNDFKTRGQRSILTPTKIALMEFLHTDTETNVYPLLVSWYFKSTSQCQYQCSCTHIMSTFFLAADAVSSDSLFIVFEIQMLNVAMLTTSLHLGKLVFIFKGFQTIVFLFIVISTTFRPICPPTFFMCLVSKFLRRSLMVFIIKGFRTIVFIFIIISRTFQPICPPAFLRCLSNTGTYTELWTTSFIESTGIACSDSVSHNRVLVLSIPVLLLAYS